MLAVKIIMEDSHALVLDPSESEPGKLSFSLKSNDPFRVSLLHSCNASSSCLFNGLQHLNSKCLIPSS